MLMSPRIILAGDENHLLITLPPSSFANQTLTCCHGRRLRRGCGWGVRGFDRQPSHAFATLANAGPLSQRQKIRLTGVLGAPAWKSDYRRGSPQFPGHGGVHRKHSGLENVHLFLSARTRGGSAGWVGAFGVDQLGGKLRPLAEN